MTKNHMLSVRLGDALVQRLDQIARLSQDSRSSVVRALLSRAVEVEQTNRGGRNEMEPCSMT